MFLSPSAAARRLKVSTKALRLYESRGLIAPDRNPAGWRAYGPETMAKAREITALRGLGLSLAQIGRLLDAPQEREAVLVEQLSRLQAQAAALRTALAPPPIPSAPLAAFDLPWPWNGERFELRDTAAITYLIGPMGLDRPWDGSHDWEPVTIPNATWDTPIWKANRKGNFMLTEEHKAHPWVFEDAGLRLEDSAALGFKAVELYDQAIAAGGDRVDDLRIQREIVYKTSRSLRAKGIHFLLTLAAQDARMVQHDDKQFAIVAKRIEGLLEQDVANQGSRPEVVAKLAEFRKDPQAWITANLAPRSYESKAAPDWSKWVPRQE